MRNICRGELLLIRQSQQKEYSKKNFSSLLQTLIIFERLESKTSCNHLLRFYDVVEKMSVILVQLQILLKLWNHCAQIYWLKISVLKRNIVFLKVTVLINLRNMPKHFRQYFLLEALLYLCSLYPGNCLYRRLFSITLFFEILSRHTLCVCATDVP